MENTIIELLTHPTVLTTIFVGAAMFALVYILKIMVKNEGVIERKTKSEPLPHTEGKKKDTTHASKTKKKVAENRWTSRTEKQVYSHPWLLTNLKGHTGSVLDMDYSSNGKYLTSCGDEDADPGSLASGESSGSSSESNNKGGCSRSPSLEPGPRNRKGLSRRQRKNRRREPPVAPPEKPKKARAKKLSSSSSETDINQQEDMAVSVFVFAGYRDVFEKIVLEYMLSYDLMVLCGYPLEMVVGDGVTIHKSLKHFIKFKTTKFDVNAREFVPRHDSTDSGQGSSSDSGEGSDQETTPCHQAYKSSASVTHHRYERKCVRCGSVFYTTANRYITLDKCDYHWGRLQAGYYSCCKARDGTPGCSTGRLHVWNGVVPGSNGPFTNYIRTQPPTRLTGKYGVYALDCEMSYTVRGLDCTKVTVVNTQGVAVYNSYVRPEHDIVDYNTRFSGITPEHMGRGARPLRVVQAELLSFINSQTILIGHGLESDLRALRITHLNVVDTSHVFPHPQGLPYRRSLKSVAISVLKKHIQANDRGHDSYEDAATCMELLLWKIRRDYPYVKPLHR